MFRGGVSAVSDIHWIEGNPPPGLAIVLRPRGDDWLEHELRRIAQSGIDTVISLLEPDEAELLGLGEERETAERVGLEFLSYPIPDGHVPSNVTQFRSFIREVAARLAEFEHIGVHCRGSIGRATITAACSLIHLGWDARDALEAIAEARGFAVPDTLEQEDWILSYRAEP
jgi:protein-tyrosine phosphatase